MSLGTMKSIDLRMVPYGRDAKTHEHPVEPAVVNPKIGAKIKYRHCLKNHAAAIGGHANDGCGEFMPSSSAGDPLTCAACGCHRNFHFKEVYDGAGHQSPPSTAVLSYSSGGPSREIVGFGKVSDGLFGDEGDRRSETPEVVVCGGGMSAARNKRFRTKFSAEQKEKMLEFAAKLGWRIQRQDDAVLNNFCSEIGVKRNVLKVWMHNNKNAHRRREPGPASPPPPPSPPAPQQTVGV